jgi:hypothetical protein
VYLPHLVGIREEAELEDAVEVGAGMGGGRPCAPVATTSRS